MVTKQVLIQYADLQKECKELRKRIEKLEHQIAQIENDGNVVDKVMGGAGGLQSFKIEGVSNPGYSKIKTKLYREKILLSELEIDLLKKSNDVLRFIMTIDSSRIRRIVSFRLLDGLKWSEVASRMGEKYTENGVRKSFNRFIA